MNSLTLARICKAVALFGFILPWMTVSCSNQPIATISGLDLATGNLRMTNPMNGVVQSQHVPPATVILLALAVIAAGLLVSFVIPPRRDRLIALLAGAALAGVLCIIGLAGAHDARQQQAVANNSGQTFDQSVAAMIQVRTRFGFWITLLGLGAAGGISAAALAGREITLPAGGFKLPATLSGDGGDDDLKFWDGLADKTDPDALQEYLVRFPNGRFVELARSRLVQKGHAPIVAEPAPPQPAAAPTAPAAEV